MEFRKLFLKYLSSEVPLQDRVCYVLSLCALSASVVGTIGTLSINLPVVCVVLSFIAVFVILALTVYVFISQKTKIVSLIMNIIVGNIILPFIFLTEGGTKGGSLFFFMIVSVSIAFTINQNIKKYFIAFCIFEYVCLMLFENFFPEKILSIPENTILGDKILSFSITFLFLFLYADLFARQYARDYRKLKKMKEMYSHQANTDALTELFNRRFFDDLFQKEILNYQNSDSETKIFLAMFDIDDFKKINDTYGHPVGDRVLEEFADILFEESHNSSVCCRYGGEEFLIMIKGLSFNYAYAKAESILNKTRTRIFCGNEKNPVTVSAGFVLCEKGSSYAEILKSVDSKLYEAKKTGKNRVVY